MKYSQEMILKSPSGYCMPFEERDREVVMSLGYGKQTNPQTGLEFFHHGVDFAAPHYLLSAVASGTVSGIGTDSVHGTYQVIRYGDYEVTYGHLSNILAGYGERVRAGQTVSVSGDLLHMETKYKGEELDPIEFLTMIYGNIRSLERRNAGMESDDISAIAEGLHTRYDRDAEEIEELMLRFFPAEHPDDGLVEEVFLRGDALHGESHGAGTQERPAGGEGAEPPHRRLPELPRADPRDVPVHVG